MLHCGGGAPPARLNTFFPTYKQEPNMHTCLPLSAHAPHVE